MKWLKKTWDWLNGKKTNIGVVAYLIARLFPMIIPSAQEYADMAKLGIEYFLFGTITHKGLKTEMAKKIGDNIKKAVKKK